jgi:hypothetical protein
MLTRVFIYTKQYVCTCIMYIIKEYICKKNVQYFYFYLDGTIRPLWFSGHSSWIQIQRSRVRLLALPDK